MEEGRMRAVGQSSSLPPWASLVFEDHNAVLIRTILQFVFSKVTRFRVQIWWRICTLKVQEKLQGKWHKHAFRKSDIMNMEVAGQLVHKTLKVVVLMFIGGTYSRNYTEVHKTLKHPQWVVGCLQNLKMVERDSIDLECFLSENK